MADDLDAFFDEVDKVEEQVNADFDKNSSNGVLIVDHPKDDDKQEVGAQPPLAKKQRLSSDISSSAKVSGVPPTTGRGTVVVAKKAVIASALPQPSSHEKKEHVIHHITVPEHLTQQQPSIQPPLPTQPPLPPGGIPIENKSKAIKRSAAGKSWTDETLADFPENDFRLFVGNLPKDVNDAKLAEAFSSKYSSFVMAKIIYDKTSQTSKGYGFVSLLDARECARAIREMDQSWLGSRPIKVKFSDWKDRDAKEVQKNKRKNKKGNKRW